MKKTTGFRWYVLLIVATPVAAMFSGFLLGAGVVGQEVEALETRLSATESHLASVVADKRECREVVEGLREVEEELRESMLAVTNVMGDPWFFDTYSFEKALRHLDTANAVDTEGCL